MIAPRGNIITTVGDPNFVAQDLSSTIQTDVIPSLDAVAAAPKGVRIVVAGLRKISEWRAFFHLHSIAPSSSEPKFLIHSDHGVVSIMRSDIPNGRAVSSSTTRATIRRITGAPCLGRLKLSAGTHCPQCGLTTTSGESLERHVVRCPNGGMRHMMHVGLANVLVSILKDVGEPCMAVVTEARGLRTADASRVQTMGCGCPRLHRGRSPPGCARRGDDNIPQHYPQACGYNTWRCCKTS